jgi:hypothetical protein
VNQIKRPFAPEFPQPVKGVMGKAGTGGSEAWQGLCAHNPKIAIRFDNRFHVDKWI